MKKFKKALLISAITLAIIFALVIIFISPIAKYLVQKYDEKYTGRQITMDHAYVNLLTGFIHFSNLKIYEFKSDSVFLSAAGVSANFSMYKLFSKTYEISELILDKPKGIIAQTGTAHVLNFQDLIEKFSPKKINKVRSPTHFSILAIKINEGEFYYRENIVPINYFIKKVNIDSQGIRWDADTITSKFSFSAGNGTGEMKGDFALNYKNMNYHFSAIANKYDLSIIGQYLKDLTHYGNFSANIDADLKVNGNFKDPENIAAKGTLGINDFHFGKNKHEDYASFDKAVIAITELSPKNHKYLFDSVSIDHPYIKYERFDHLDNFQTIFGKKGDKVSAVAANSTKFNLVIEIGRYIKILSKNFFKSNYKVNRLAVYAADLKFNDFSINEKFSANLHPFYVSADSIDKNHNRVKLSLRSEIKPYGTVSVMLSINPKNEEDFDLTYHLQKLPIAMFNPYIISYTSFPVDRGTMELQGKWEVKGGEIQSKNHLVIIDPRVTKKIKNENTKWIPLRMIMSFIRESGNVIDYEIPITGNLKKPKFHFKDVIFDVLGNIFVKPITTLYRMKVKRVETEIEKSLTLKWEMRHSLLSNKQEKFVNHMADFLAENPGASITVHPQTYTEKEKEYILYFEAKKKYFLACNKKTAQALNYDDTLNIDKMSVKDSLFIEYLNKHIDALMAFTVQEKCLRFIGADLISRKYQQLNHERACAFMLPFKNKETENRIKIHADKNIIPYNGFSFYKIEYKGELPKSLIKAYSKMNGLNEEAPRKEFEKERRSNNKTQY